MDPGRVRPAGRRDGSSPDSRLRVAIDATPLLGLRSGIGVVTALLIAALATRDDLEVAAYAVSWHGRKDLGKGLPPGAALIDRRMPDRPLHRAWERFGRPRIEWWSGPIDVVHGTNYDVPPARRAARVVTVNDLSTVRFPDLCQVATRPFPARVRRAIAEGAFVHTPSAFVAAEVIELLGADPAHVCTVPYGVPPVAPAPATEATAADGRPYILAVGTIEARKDYPTLVRAFDRLAAAHPEVDLVIAGADGGAQGALHAAIDDAYHKDRISTLGWIGDRRRDSLLRAAAVLAYPSLYEGFGLPPLEAMTVGVPVVATDGGSLPEVLGDGARLVPVGDADALAAALALVLDDGATRETQIERGRLQVARYSWAACAQGLVDLYRDAAARR
jgi:glycosyltransferase involved in cell wall biosynthesis